LRTVRFGAPRVRMSTGRVARTFPPDGGSDVARPSGETVIADRSQDRRSFLDLSSQHAVRRDSRASTGSAHASVRVPQGVAASVQLGTTSWQPQAKATAYLSTPVDMSAAASKLHGWPDKCGSALPRSRYEYASRATVSFDPTTASFDPSSTCGGRSIGRVGETAMRRPLFRDEHTTPAGGLPHPRG
jgi:hypothetical protein